MKDVLVVEDDALSRDFVENCVGSMGLAVKACSDGDEAFRSLDNERYRLVITDLKLPGADGFEILKKVQSTNPDTDVIVVTGYGSVENAVECMRQGAFDFLVKPVSKTRLDALVNRVIERQDLIAETKTLRRRAAAPNGDDEIVCKSKEMQSVLELARAVADTDSTVLIRGESGTGKELVAAAIHKSSRRASSPLVCVNCSALPEGLLESELFGHEKGAFTSAIAQKPGMFELADRGTVFLDEIGELSPALQVKLLRVLETQNFQRVGGTKTIEVNVRVISATNRDLEMAREEGLFREDLYYRLNVVEIRIPPLRDRTSDIPPLAERVLWRISASAGGRPKSISAPAMECIMRFHWPGNVRELQNVLERSTIVCKGEEIQVEDLPDYVVGGLRPAEPNPGQLKPLEEIEVEYVKLALKICGGNKSKAAKLLRIDRGTLARKLRSQPGEGGRRQNDRKRDRREVVSEV
jgi:DNA-binding NtrC family response regulator